MPGSVAAIATDFVMKRPPDGYAWLAQALLWAAWVGSLFGLLMLLAGVKPLGNFQKAPCMVMSRLSSPMSRMRGHSVFQP